MLPVCDILVQYVFPQRPLSKTKLKQKGYGGRSNICQEYSKRSCREVNVDGEKRLMPFPAVCNHYMGVPGGTCHDCKELTGLHCH